MVQRRNAQEMQVPRLRFAPLGMTSVCLAMVRVSLRRGVPRLYVQDYRSPSWFLCSYHSTFAVSFAVSLPAELLKPRRRRGRQLYRVLVPASVAREPVQAAASSLSAPYLPSAAGGDTPVFF